MCGKVLRSDARPMRVLRQIRYNATERTPYRLCFLLRSSVFFSFFSVCILLFVFFPHFYFLYFTSQSQLEWLDRRFPSFPSSFFQVNLKLFLEEMEMNGTSLASPYSEKAPVSSVSCFRELHNVLARLHFYHRKSFGNFVVVRDLLATFVITVAEHFTSSIHAISDARCGSLVIWTKILFGSRSFSSDYRFAGTRSYEFHCAIIVFLQKSCIRTTLF